MSAVIVALQFLSVAVLGVVGIIWTGTAIIKAWNPRIGATTTSIVVTAVIGLIIFSTAVLLAGIYGWISS